MKSRLSFAIAAALGAGLPPLAATENVPHAPFGGWASLPPAGELRVRVSYQESESYRFWAGHTRHSAEHRARGERYGIDVTQGFVSLDYGLTERWAADLAVGYTTVGWRYFSDEGRSQSASGLMDTALGLRYRIFDEADAGECPWVPALSFRVGVVLPGTFDKHFPFAPGNASAAIEPGLIARKHFGWRGFGMYGDALFRWNRTAANDQYIVSVGFFQEIQRWELNAGYRRLGSVNGDNIRFDPAAPEEIDYPRSLRENQNSVEAGFSYTFLNLPLTLGFYSRSVFSGVNTDKKFWVGGFAEMPFDLRKQR